MADSKGSGSPGPLEMKKPSDSIQTFLDRRVVRKTLYKHLF